MNMLAMTQQTKFMADQMALYGGMLLTAGDGDDLGGGIRANTAAANRLLSGLMGPVGLILGIIVWVVTVGIVIYTAFEIMYVVFPFMHNAISGEAGEKKGKGLDKMVSGDARRAVEIGDRGEANPLVYYLKSRIIVYVVLGAMIVILVTGTATNLMNLGAEMGNGVTNALEGVNGGVFDDVGDASLDPNGGQ